MPKVVQFTHPGGEHSHDKNNLHLKSWNTGSHKRKFMQCPGEYIDGNNTLNKGNLLFWGEWEPESHVKMLEKISTEHPKWLHSPFKPHNIPDSTGYHYSNISNKTSYQNTDPYVFGDNFKYLVCKQIRKNKNGYSSTLMSKLEKGSIVLFGSTEGKNRTTSFFKLDTVFVVESWIDYSPSDPKALINTEEDYYNLSYKMAFPNPKEENQLPLRFYKGATYTSQVNGMYSFSPSKIYDENLAIGFPRVKLQDLGNYFTNNLNAAPKISDFNKIEDIINIWSKIREISRKQGCIEGVKFNLNK